MQPLSCNANFFFSLSPPPHHLSASQAHGPRISRTATECRSDGEVQLISKYIVVVVGQADHFSVVVGRHQPARETPETQSAHSLVSVQRAESRVVVVVASSPPLALSF